MRPCLFPNGVPGCSGETPGMGDAQMLRVRGDADTLAPDPPSRFVTARNLLGMIRPGAKGFIQVDGDGYWWVIAAELE